MATDFFLKIEGVDGESVDDQKKGWIEIESWSWGATQQGTQGFGGGGGAGKVSVQDFHITKKVDKSTQDLLKSCTLGKHYGSAKMVARKATGAGGGTTQGDYLLIELKDVLVSSYQSGGQGSGGELPMEQVSINFAQVKWEYKIQDSKGALVTAGKFGYDLKSNKEVG